MRSVLMKVLGVFIIVAAIAGFVTLLEYPSYHASDEATAKMKSLADRVQPGTGWTPEANRVMGTFLCTPGDVPCDSLLRRWYPDHRLTTDEFTALVKKTGWDMKATPSCDPPRGSSGLIELCSATALIDSYDVKISQIRTGADSGREVLLAVWIEKHSKT